MQIADFLQRFPYDPSRSLAPQSGSSVYSTLDQTTGQTQVLKVKEFLASKDDGTWQTREEEAAQIQHPNLVPYEGVYRFVEGDTAHHFRCMPRYHKGSLLRASVHEWTATQKIDVLESVLNALQKLHQVGQTAQMLHAAHILLDDSGVLKQSKLINYGGSKALPLAFHQNYEYLAPEQLDDSLPLGPKADIWAFGVLTFWLFTQQLPFGRLNTRYPNHLIRVRILKAQLPSLIDEIPNPWRELITRCLRFDAAQRWESVEEIQAFIRSQQAEVQQAPAQIEPATLDDEDYSPGLIHELLDRRGSGQPVNNTRWFIMLLLGVGVLAALLYLAS